MKAGFFSNANKPKPAAQPKKEEKNDIIEVKATKSIRLEERFELILIFPRGFEGIG